MILTDILALTFLTIGMFLIFSLVKGLKVKTLKGFINKDYSDIPSTEFWRRRFAFRIGLTAVFAAISQYLLLYNYDFEVFGLISAIITVYSVFILLKYDKWSNVTIHVFGTYLWGFNFIAYILLLILGRSLLAFFVIGLLIYLAIGFLNKIVLRSRGAILSELSMVVWFYITVILVSTDAFNYFREVTLSLVNRY